MGKLNQTELKLLDEIKEYIEIIFKGITIKTKIIDKDASTEKKVSIIDASCYGNELPKVEDSVEGQIFFLIGG